MLFIFLGHADGYLELFNIHYLRPLFQWRIEDVSLWPPVGVRKVVWSPHRPSILFCLTTAGELAVWTLVDDSRAKIKPCRKNLFGPTGKKQSVVDFSFSENRRGYLTICWHNGIEIHWLTSDLLLPKEYELQRLENALNDLF